MAHVLLSDVIASFEQYLVNNWPDSTVKFVPSGADSRRSFTDNTKPTKWVESQWLDLSPVQPMRANEDWCSFDLRINCFARTNDRLAVAAIADNFKQLVRGVNIVVVDRDDGSTEVGRLTVNEVSVTPPQKLETDTVACVVDVIGWVVAS